MRCSVITAQVSITVSRKYFEYTTTKLKDRDIECTTTKVELKGRAALWLAGMFWFSSPGT